MYNLNLTTTEEDFLSNCPNLAIHKKKQPNQTALSYTYAFNHSEEER